MFQYTFHSPWIPNCLSLCILSACILVCLVEWCLGIGVPYHVTARPAVSVCLSVSQCVCLSMYAYICLCLCPEVVCSNPTRVRDFFSFSVWAHFLFRADAQKVLFGIFIRELLLITFKPIYAYVCLSVFQFVCVCLSVYASFCLSISRFECVHFFLSGCVRYQAFCLVILLL